jgi:single-strand DNA-binding protein
MAHVIIPGNLGRDAEYKQTQSGQELCRFTVASDSGFGDSKQTTWFDVTKWGKGSRGLADLLRKGSKVTVIGELSTREHEGKTYLQCRADNITVHSATGEKSGGHGAARGGGGDGWTPGNQPPADDLDDDIPFATRNSIF